MSRLLRLRQMAGDPTAGHLSLRFDPLQITCITIDLGRNRTCQNPSGIGTSGRLQEERN